MPKYTGKTYSRARKRECKSSSIFDEVVQHEEETSPSNDNSTENPKAPNSLPKKSSWSRVHKAVAKNLENSPVKNAPKGGKRTKRLQVIDEHDPFAFTEDLEDNSLAAGTHKSQVLSDKSTDDEAYSSSQECSNASSKRSRRKTKDLKPSSSPFKSFLKNNDKSLSPLKNKGLRRLSALPTNSNFSDEESKEESGPVIPTVVRSSSWPTHGNKNIDQEGLIRVKRTEKPLFTVIQNVKKMSECLESGEDQEFFDDIEYLLDGLGSSHLSTRCLSALEVASRCTSATFRINLRAHGIIPKIFELMRDAHTDKNLALCTSAIMYVLTQDKQNIDLDKFILEMMMKFLSVSDTKDSEEKSHKNYVQKARTMFEKHMSRIPGAYLDLEDICASSIARESLLSITSERAGVWFKSEIRILGGLDHIVNAVTECVDWLSDVHGNYIQKDLDSQAKIQRINKCLKLIENVTYENDVNQKYLIQHHKGSLARDIARFVKQCVNTVTEGFGASSSSSSDLYIYNEATIDECLLNSLKVFLNLSHECDEGSNLIGQQTGLLSSLLFCVLQLPQYLEERKRFDLHVLGLGLMINLVEHSKQNIATLVQLKTEPFHESQNTSSNSMADPDGKIGSVEALLQLFVMREEAARNTDEMTNALSPEDEEEEVLKPTKDGLGWVCGHDIDMSVDESKASSSKSPKKDAKKTSENLEDEIGKALVIAGKHMEDSMVASYVALLLGCILQDNKSGTSGHSIEKILRVLQKCSEANQ